MLKVLVVIMTPCWAPKFRTAELNLKRRFATTAFTARSYPIIVPLLVPVPITVKSKTLVVVTSPTLGAKLYTAESWVKILLSVDNVHRSIVFYPAITSLLSR